MSKGGSHKFGAPFNPSTSSGRTEERDSPNRYSGYLMVSSFKEAEVLAARGVMLDLPLAVIYDTFSTRHLAAYK